MTDTLLAPVLPIRLGKATSEWCEHMIIDWKEDKILLAGSNIGGDI